MDEFVNKLTVETHMSRSESENLVSFIMRWGNLDDAIKIYDEEGINGLNAFIFMIQATGVRI